MNNKIDPLDRREEAILLLNNYDSFTYSLLHVVKESGTTNIGVFRNDEVSLEEVERFDKVILSPGPGISEETRLLLPIIRKYTPTKSISGVCLGHQTIGEVFGAALGNLTEIYHGVQIPVSILKGDVLFKGLGHEALVSRYHSWVVSRKDFPKCLEITVESCEEQIVVLWYHTYNIHDIRFHLESMLAPQGEEIIKNFLNQ